eukprot:scaffold67412_cov67-Cyclotella_meneghiniana.AAC.1
MARLKQPSLKRAKIYTCISPHTPHTQEESSLDSSLAKFFGFVAYAPIVRMQMPKSSNSSSEKDDLLPIFERAEINATKYLRRTDAESEQMAKDKWKQSKKQVFFHLQYHPEDPQTREIQKLWRDLVSDPP